LIAASAEQPPVHRRTGERPAILERHSMIHDYCVIGGGIVGLATARAILLRNPGASLILLEKEPAIGLHQTGRNSGVIHSGIYYAPGSLKAKLCARGLVATKQYCIEHRIPFEERGKLIVASSEAELGRLAALAERAKLNGIVAHPLTASGIREREPNVAGIAALHIPSTGIVDYRQVLASLANEVRTLGGVVRLLSRVVGASEAADEVGVSIDDGDEIRCRRLVACAGLFADRLAIASGLAVRHQIVPFRGEFFELPERLNSVVTAMIYPVPDPALPFLGIHVTPTMRGAVTLGPNAVLALSREGYRKTDVSLRDIATYASFPGFWRTIAGNLGSGVSEMMNSLSRRRYLAACQRYVPSLQLADLTPAPAGVRAQAVARDGTLVHDFLFQKTARMLHVLNAPSPAATAALPIADMIVDRLESQTSDQ
jgi:L-2-hydroxyglutarate oxidase